jgi:hypothetical protein
MKNVLRTLMIVVMTITLANCSGGGGGGSGGSGKKAKAPNRDECRYDVRRGYYRDEVGDRCDYRDYHNGDACYNYAYQPHTNYTRGESRYGGREWKISPVFTSTETVTS